MVYNKSAAVNIIQRVGRNCTIQRATVTGADSYRNPTKSWGTVATEKAARIYPYLRLWPRQEETPAGDLDVDNPIFLFRKGADVLDGDRLTYDGATYRVRTVMPMETHTRVEAQRR